MKRFLSEFKIGATLRERRLSKDESKDLLRSIVQMEYYKIIGNKNKWNKVFKNHFQAKLTKNCLNLNGELEFQKVCLEC